MTREPAVYLVSPLSRPHVQSWALGRILLCCSLVLSSHLRSSRTGRTTCSCLAESPCPRRRRCSCGCGGCCYCCSGPVLLLLGLRRRPRLPRAPAETAGPARPWGHGSRLPPRRAAQGDPRFRSRSRPDPCRSPHFSPWSLLEPAG